MTPSRPQSPTTPRRCLGFDEKGNYFACPNPAGTPWTDLWCAECDERRKAAITASLEAIVNGR